MIKYQPYSLTLDYLYNFTAELFSRYRDLVIDHL